MMHATQPCSNENFKLNMADSINTKPLSAFLICSYDWSEIQAKQAIEQYLNFLCLTWLYPDRLLVPTQLIDQVWHCHILHTRQYRQDCEALFGCYLDHEPHPSSNQLYDQSLQSAFEQTKVLFERHFGTGSFEDHFNEQPAACGRLERHPKLGDFNGYSDPGACGRPAS